MFDILSVWQVSEQLRRIEKLSGLAVIRVGRAKYTYTQYYNLTDQNMDPHTGTSRRSHHVACE